jgi:hypothetical protein
LWFDLLVLEHKVARPNFSIIIFKEMIEREAVAAEMPDVQEVPAGEAQAAAPQQRHLRKTIDEATTLQLLLLQQLHE